MLFSTAKVEVEVTVKTGDVRGAGTDSNIYCALIDEEGKRSRDIILNCLWENNFERGDVDVFKVKEVGEIGRYLNLK